MTRSTLMLIAALSTACSVAESAPVPADAVPGVRLSAPAQTNVFRANNPAPSAPVVYTLQAEWPSGLAATVDATTTARISQPGRLETGTQVTTTSALTTEATDDGLVVRRSGAELGQVVNQQAIDAEAALLAALAAASESIGHAGTLADDHTWSTAPLTDDDARAEARALVEAAVQTALADAEDAPSDIDRWVRTLSDDALGTHTLEDSLAGRWESEIAAWNGRTWTLGEVQTSQTAARLPLHGTRPVPVTIERRLLQREPCPGAPLQTCVRLQTTRSWDAEATERHLEADVETRLAAFKSKNMRYKPQLHGARVTEAHEVVVRPDELLPLHAQTTITTDLELRFGKVKDVRRVETASTESWYRWDRTATVASAR